MKTNTIIVSEINAAAARRYLTPESAAMYAAGDMTVTDDAGHEAIAGIASEISAEKLEALA